MQLYFLFFWQSLSFSSFYLVLFNRIVADIPGVNLASYFVLYTCPTILFTFSFSQFALGLIVWECVYLNYYAFFLIICLEFIHSFPLPLVVAWEILKCVHEINKKGNDYFYLAFRQSTILRTFYLTLPHPDSHILAVIFFNFYLLKSP